MRVILTFSSPTGSFRHASGDAGHLSLDLDGTGRGPRCVFLDATRLRRRKKRGANAKRTAGAIVDNRRKEHEFIPIHQQGSRPDPMARRADPRLMRAVRVSRGTVIIL